MILFPRRIKNNLSTICPREVNRSKLNSTRIQRDHFQPFSPSFFVSKIEPPYHPSFHPATPLPVERGGLYRCPFETRPTKDWWNKKSSESLLTLGYASISVTKHDIVPSPSLLLLPLFTGSPRRFAARRGSTNPGWWRDTAMLGIYYLTPLVVQRPLFAFCVSRRGHSAPRSLVRFRFRRGRIVLERVDVRKPRGGAWWIVSACVRACIFQRYQDTARRIRQWRILGSSNFLPFFFRQSLLFSLSLSPFEFENGFFGWI